jgi:NAD(P)-dependent dehydrogenase (short-subunit alcohol dehydrogenase family)
MKVQNSTALVTGANRGLGLAFARELHARGAKTVYAGVRNPGGLDIPGLVPVKLDVTDPDSVHQAATRCGDVTLLVNNAGIAGLNSGALDQGLIDSARQIFETNFNGGIRMAQAFTPVIAANGGGAIVNVLSDAAWFSQPILTAYSAAKSAAWNFTNALRLDLREKRIQVLGLHVGYIDTDLSKGVPFKKSDPRDIAARTLDALEAGAEEILADAQANAVKRSLSTAQAYYLNPLTPV